MPLYGMSRYLKVKTRTIVDSDNEAAEVYNRRSTYVHPLDLPEDTKPYIVSSNEIYEDIAEKMYPSLGGADLWFVLADCNPQIFYPLDLKEGDIINIPPPDWVEEYVLGIES